MSKAALKAREWRKENREHAHLYATAYVKQRHWRLRQLVDKEEKCFVCQRQVPRLEFHHRSYVNGHPKTSRERYAEVEKFPDRFVLLCRACHFALTFYSKDPLRIMRLAQLVPVETKRE